ncbi:hypothetical protein [Bacillus sp. 1P06AnD]|uniref:hypothetical protein n=1 Tax=Bacillus sp. 1P06AnD TaxID=3132208 RepID=UPI0039A0735E
MNHIIPIIPEDKNYWLIRTQSGKYYVEYRRKGFIAINWNKITLDDIKSLSSEDLAIKVKEEYPDKQRPGGTANQLRIFKDIIKKGDTVVITGVNSNKFSIGEVIEDECFEENITKEMLDANSRVCPYKKRKRVRWIKEVHKWDVEMPMFKLLQHAQHTISDANEYKDVIESMIHDFYIRGNYAQLSLKVKKEENIPMSSFFALGKEILELAEEYLDYSLDANFDLDSIETQINVNSPGKIKLKGPMTAILILGLLIVGATGGGISVRPPTNDSPLSVEIKTGSVITQVNDFLNERQARKQKEMIMEKYMDELEVETPDELTKLMQAVETKKTNNN